MPGRAQMQSEPTENQCECTAAPCSPVSGSNATIEYVPCRTTRDDTRMSEREQAVLRRIRDTPPGFVRAYGDVSPGAPRFAGAVLSACDDPTCPGTGSCGLTDRLQRASASAACSRPRACRSAASGWTCVSLGCPEFKSASTRCEPCRWAPMARARERNPLADPVRLSMLRATGSSAHRPRRPSTASPASRASASRRRSAMVALLDDRHLHVKACIGRPELAKAGGPHESFCQPWCRRGAVVVDDAREHELTRASRPSSPARCSPTPASRSRSPAGSSSARCPSPTSSRATGSQRDRDARGPRRLGPDRDRDARGHRGARQAEADLQRSTDRLRGLIDNSPTVIYAKDLEGR